MHANLVCLLAVACFALQLFAPSVHGFATHGKIFGKTSSLLSRAAVQDGSADSKTFESPDRYDIIGDEVDTAEDISFLWGNQGDASSKDDEISLLKEGINFPTTINGSDVRVGIIMARWNGDVIKGLYKGVNESLAACGVKQSNIFTTYVPGAFELPVTARFLAASKRVDVVIALGCLIKGDTMHFEYIAQAVSSGLMQVSIDSYVPCIFGVLTVLDKEQAVKRSTGTTNEGLTWGTSAVEMGLARMSALGMDKSAAKKVDSTPFVTFNGTIANPDGKNSSQPARKIGF